MNNSFCVCAFTYGLPAERNQLSFLQHCLLLLSLVTQAVNQKFSILQVLSIRKRNE